VLNAGTFNAAERREVQRQFDTAFGDLLQYLRDYVTADREGPMSTAIVDRRDGTRWFPDDILAYLLWVEARRTDPDARLDDYDDLSEAALRSAHVRGILGKAGTASTKPKRFSSGPASSGSSEVA
jgi:hypothetical protein